MEYDILVSAGSAGTEFHTGEIYLNYSLDAFAFNIVTSGNFTLTNGSFLQNNNYNVTAENWGGGTIKILVEAGDPSDLEVLPTSPVQLLHLKMVGDDCDEDAGLYFDESFMAGKQLHLENSLLVAYDPVVANSAYFQPSCSETLPIIFDFSPKVVSAGIGNEVTITGLNFGGDKGKVIFRDADSPTTLYDKTLSVDIVEWADEEITTKVPSILENSGTAGTGRVGVETANSLSTIRIKKLTVNYAVINNIPQFDTIPYRVSLIQQDENIGYKFAIDSFLANQPGVSACIDKALFELSCQTGVTWEVTTILNFQGNAAIDGKNVIFWGGSPADTALAHTHLGGERYQGCLNSNGDQNYYINDVDIEINAFNAWHFDCNSDTIPAGTYDLFYVLLHELAHAHMLDHALPDGKLMHPTLGVGERTGVAVEDKNGGLDVMGYGATNLNGDCPEFNDTGFPPGCTNATDEAGKLAHPNIEVYPNPFNGRLTVETNLGGQAYSIRVFDQLGRVLAQKDKIKENKVVLEELGKTLAAGMYVLQIYWEEGIASKIIIKSK
ncbi:MAG TPA: T9SS type A sorting domain-containing protein [Bacteroidetes bacterium]|nr:T9SS type A sorting domain-containing protein [Bacteroidota bacterium]